MISIGSVRDISDKYDEVWMIVRSLKSVPQCNIPVYHVPALSPSKELFDCYLSWKTAGCWNKNTFETCYKPRFLKEMESPEARGMIGILKERAKDKHILLACYCPADEICHRSLVYQIILQDTFYLLVAGSRNFIDYSLMCRILDHVLSKQVAIGNKIVIVSGDARGADELAERYADERGYDKEIMPADWNKHGKSAGYKRNTAMHEFIAMPSARKRGCICFWDGTSKGTQHNFGLAKKYGTPLKVYNYTESRYLTEEEVSACS